MDLRSFDPGHYQTPMATARRRLEQARSMQEPDCVPVTLSTGGSFYCRLFGVNIRDYYRAAFDNPDLQIELQLQGLRWAFEELRDDRTGCGLYLDLGPIGETFAFDLYGDFAAAKPAVDHALQVGMPGGGYALAVGGETYTGVNPQTLCQVVACAREAGPYPATR